MKEKIIFVYLCQILACVEIRLNLNRVMGFLFAVHGYTGILLVGPPHGKNINKYIQNEGIYTYPGLENASWKIFKGKTHVMYTEFTPSKTKTTYGITYLGGGDVKDPYQDKFAEVVMSNYIIPSIEPLYGLDNYSHVKHWDNFSYRIPKKAKLVSEAMEDNKYEVRTYEDVGVKIRVLRFRIDPNIVDKSLAKKQIFTFLNKYGDLEAPTQYATVWNNGLPGFLIDRYKPNGESYLRHFTKDSEYYYSYRIDYDEKQNLCININNCAIWSSMSALIMLKVYEKKRSGRIDNKP